MTSNSGFSGLQRRGSMENRETGEYGSEQAPSIPSGGQRSFGAAYGVRSVQPERDDEYADQPPSQSNMYPQVYSWNDGDRMVNPSDNGGQPPSRNDLVHENKSGKDLGVPTNEKSAPSHNNLVHPNISESAGGAPTEDAAPINPLDYVGISLVGRRFKDVNPTAYYVEKNDR